MISSSLTCANSKTASKKFSLKKFLEKASSIMSQMSMNSSLNRQLLLLPHSEIHRKRRRGRTRVGVQEEEEEREGEEEGEEEGGRWKRSVRRKM